MPCASAAQTIPALLPHASATAPPQSPSPFPPDRSAGLSDWRFYWSLHPDNKRYSGTALAVHPAYAPLAVRFDLRGLVDLGIKYPLVANSQKAAASEDVSRWGGACPFTLNPSVIVDTSFVSSGGFFM